MMSSSSSTAALDPSTAASSTTPASPTTSSTATTLSPVAAVTVPSASMWKSGFAAADLKSLASTICSPAGADYVVSSSTARMIVFHDPKARRDSLAAALVMMVESPTGSSGSGSVSPVVLVKADPDRAGPRYFVWCGDDFLEGSLSGPDLRRRIHGAVSAARLPLADQVAVDRDLMASAGSCPASTSDKSHFWGPYSHDPRSLGCKHVRHALWQISQVPGAFDERIAEIDTLWDRFTPTSSRSSSPHITSPTASSPSESVDPRLQAKIDLENRFRSMGPKMVQILEKAGPRKQHKMPILMLGQPGQGKTFDFRTLGSSALYDGYFEYSCSSGQDEYHVLGGTREACVADAAGNLSRTFPHVPSTIVRAIQAAAAGAESGKVYALLIEELPSLKDDVWNIFKTMLNPFKGTYRIETTRVVGFDADGQGIPEVIECPRHALSIFATGNIGEQSQSYFGDAAAMNRFYCMYLEEDPALIVTAASTVAAEQGFSSAATDSLNKFMRSMVKMKADNEVVRLPNIRDLDDAIRLCEGQERSLQGNLSDFAYRWVGQDLYHQPNREQIAIVRRCLVDAFKPSV